MPRLVFACVLTTTAAAFAAEPRRDRDGEPLPVEAVQRLGSARFLVNNLAAAAFSPDGKTVYTVSEEDDTSEHYDFTSPGLIAWEVPTGKKLWQVGVDRQFEQVVADPDGKSVWVLERFKADEDETALDSERIQFSSRDGRELARTTRIKDWNTATLHPSGLLACLPADDELTEPTIRVINREGESTDIRPFEPAIQNQVFAIAWSPKGDRLFALSWHRELQDSCLTTLDVTNSKQIWSKAIDSPIGVCVSSDGKSLALVTKAQTGEKVSTVARHWDAATGKEVARLEVPDLLYEWGIGLEIALEGRIHFHPDGKRVFLLDKAAHTIAIDVATWKKVATEARILENAVLSTDGRMYVAPAGRHVVISETETGKRISPHEPGFSRTGNELQFTPTSERVIRPGSYMGPQIEWEVVTGREVSRTEWKEPDRTAERNVLSANGKFRAVEKSNEKSWRIEVTSAERPNDPPVVLKINYEGFPNPFSGMQFTPDAKHLVGFSKQNGLYIWDTIRGGDPVEAKFQAWDDGEFSNWGSEFHFRRDSRQVAALEFSARQGRGQFAIGDASWRIGVYELPSGKVVRRFEGAGLVELLHWLPSGQIVGLANSTPSFHPFLGQRKPPRPKFELFCLDPTTNRKQVFTLDHDVRASVASPFGDMVAVGSSDGLRLYEASTGKLRHRFREQTRPVSLLAFSPNGRYLAAESVDGPVLVWDVRGDLTKPAKPDAAGWQAAWDALGESGAEAAFQAIRLFALYPDDGLPELTKRFAELKRPSEEEVAALIQELGDRDFQVRERAEKELRALGSAAFPALKNATTENPSPEVQARASRLLAVPMPTDLLRAERAVEAVRLADTAAGRKLLVGWANGAPDDALTVAAKRTGK